MISLTLDRQSQRWQRPTSRDQFRKKKTARKPASIALTVQAGKPHQAADGVTASRRAPTANGTVGASI
jgi:hypothetical protein